MNIVDPKDLPKEGDTTKKEEKAIKLRSFQVSEHFGLVMEVIEEALTHSIVQELLSKKNGDVNESEVGRLTLVEWAARTEIQKIKNKLTKNYE
jgi:hypothetical protein